MLALLNVLLFLIEKGPGRTEGELASAIFGDKAYQQRVNLDCRLLVDRGLVERRGTGGASDPYRYHRRFANPENIMTSGLADHRAA